MQMFEQFNPWHKQQSISFKQQHPYSNANSWQWTTQITLENN